MQQLHATLIGMHQVVCYKACAKGLVPVNVLDVMTKMGRFVYYRLQPEVLHLQVGDEPLACENGDSFVFADEVVARAVEGGLQGVAKGTTYVQKHIAETDCIVAYKVVVE